jgi:hypothetical protein
MGDEQSSIYVVILNADYSHNEQAEIMPRIVKQLKIYIFDSSSIVNIFICNIIWLCLSFQALL